MYAFFSVFFVSLCKICILSGVWQSWRRQGFCQHSSNSLPHSRQMNGKNRAEYGEIARVCQLPLWRVHIGVSRPLNQIVLNHRVIRSPSPHQIRPQLPIQNRLPNNRRRKRMLSILQKRLRLLERHRIQFHLLLRVSKYVTPNSSVSAFVPSTVYGLTVE